MDKQFTKHTNHFLGSGWSFPITFSIGNLQLALTSYEQNINESIRTILLTNRGERCLEPQFGSGLHKLFFKKMDATLQGDIKDAIQTSLLNNEPRIKVIEVEVTYTDLLAGAVQASITYMYNKTNTRHNYVFPFYFPRLSYT